MTAMIKTNSSLGDIEGEQQKSSLANDESDGVYDQQDNPLSQSSANEQDNDDQSKINLLQALLIKTGILLLLFMIIRGQAEELMKLTTGLTQEAAA
jgi:hypothetical protein